MFSLSLASAERTKTTFGYTPFTEDGLPLVELQVNNEVSGNFVVDTGSTATVISSDLASRLRLKVHALIGRDGKPFLLDGKQAMGDDLTIIFAGIKLTGPVIIVPSKNLQASRSDRVDGLIGHDVLSHLAILFEFTKKEITVWYPGGFTEEEIRSLHLKDATVMDQSLAPGVAFSVPVVLNGTASLDMLVDTGGGAAVIPSKVAAELKLKPTRTGISSATVFGPMVTSEAIVDTFAIGSLLLSNQTVEYARRENASVPPRIGMEILHRFQLLIDYPAKKAYFAKPTDSKPIIDLHLPSVPGPSITPSEKK
jgi:predicted aspartyl protease